MDFKIGLAFSGGGYRAAAFNLGVLSMLKNISLDGGSVLDKVYGLSTISGGTITGARYALGIKKGESFESIYQSLYYFMLTEDLVNLSLDNLSEKRDEKDHRDRSLITAMADVYDTQLFKGAKFCELLEDKKEIHLKEISFNATDFNNGLPFRFQKTVNAEGFIGNGKYRLTKEIANEIRMADILAASSCFPGGFEPINFPNDFVLDRSHFSTKAKETLRRDIFPVGLMDGGIVDNQGIGSILLAEERMNENECEGETDFDLLIVSDVSSNAVVNYKANEQTKFGFWKNLNLWQFLLLILVVFIVSSTGVVYSFMINQLGLLLGSSILSTISFLILMSLLYFKSWPKRFGVPAMFLKPIKKLLSLKLNVLEDMIVNRKNSLLLMTGTIFMKQIRAQHSKGLFSASKWENRWIANYIDGLKSKKNITDEMREIVVRASNMETTLWFAKKQEGNTELTKEEMLRSLIVCGQFTICWKLIDYIADLKKENAKNINENHKEFIKIEPQLNAYWQKFIDENPYWFIDSITR